MPWWVMDSTRGTYSTKYVLMYPICACAASKTYIQFIQAVANYLRDKTAHYIICLWGTGFEKMQ